MPVVISKLKVKDYAAWAEQFRAGAESRKGFGVKALSYGQDRSAPGVAFVILEAESEAHAQRLFEHPVLRKNLEEQGVETLDLIFLSDVGRD